MRWTNGPNAGGSLRDTAAVLVNDTVYLRTTPPTIGSFNAGRPTYSTNTASWAGYSFESIRMARGGGSGAATHFKFKIPLDSNQIHFRISDIRGDLFNAEHQRIVGYRNNVAVAATFKDLVNGVSISGNNVNGSSTTTSTVQSAVRIFFNQAVDSVVINSISFSDFVILELFARCDIVLANANVQLQAFVKDSRAHLLWTPLPGENKIVLERSFNGTFWEAVIPVRSSESEYTDQLTKTGLHYYRLRFTDNSNNIRYSNIAKIYLQKNSEPALFHAFPNPFYNELLVSSNNKGNIQLLNAQGIVVNSIYSLTAGTIQRITTSTLPAGVYVAIITTDDGTIFQQKLIKK